MSTTHNDVYVKSRKENAMSASRFFCVRRVVFALLCTAIVLVSVFAVPSNASAAGLDPFVETSTGSASSVAYGNGVFVVVGNKVIRTSSDGYNWQSISVSQNYMDVVFADGRFVAVGYEGYVAVSTDGMNWSHYQVTGSSYGGHKPSLDEVCYADGKYYTNGAFTYGTNCINIVYSSPDGVNWNKVLDEAVPNSSMLGYTIAHANGEFLLTGWMSFGYVSTDGVTWTRISTNVSSIREIIHANGTIWGTDGYNIYTWDTMSHQWTANTTESLMYTYDLAYINDQLFALGLNSAYAPRIELSEDGGITWTQYSMTPSPSVTLSRPCDAAYGNGVYVVAARGDIYTTKPVFSVTYDGNTATSGSVPTDANTYYSGDSATILDNTGALNKDGYTFAGWNTRENGSGSSFSAGSFTNISGDLLLYAQWRQNAVTTPVPDAVIPATGDGSNVPLLLSLSLFATIGVVVSCAWVIRRKRD